MHDRDCKYYLTCGMENCFGLEKCSSGHPVSENGYYGAEIPAIKKMIDSEIMNNEKIIKILKSKAEKSIDALSKLPTGSTYKHGFDIGYNLGYAHALECAIYVLMYDL